MGLSVSVFGRSGSAGLEKKARDCSGRGGVGQAEISVFAVGLGCAADDGQIKNAGMKPAEILRSLL